MNTRSRALDVNGKKNAEEVIPEAKEKTKRKVTKPATGKYNNIPSSNHTSESISCNSFPLSSLRTLGGNRRFYGSFNCTSGTIRNGTVAIPQSFSSLSTDPQICHFSLCTSTCRLFRVSWDKGWGCTYRCIQSIYSVLVETDPYKKILPFSFTYQNIPFIQKDIEKAWLIHHIDIAGGETFGYSLEGKKDWIGTTEVASLLRSHHLNCELHDFYLNITSSSRHSSTSYHTEIEKFVCDYFSLHSTSLLASPTNARNQNRHAQIMESTLPLYFQTNGHSMVIVGIVQFADMSYGLALFDSQESSKVPRIVKCTSLKDPAYQIIKITGIYENSEQVEEGKVLIGIAHFS